MIIEIHIIVWTVNKLEWGHLIAYINVKSNTYHVYLITVIISCFVLAPYFRLICANFGSNTTRLI